MHNYFYLSKIFKPVQHTSYPRIGLTQGLYQQIYCCVTICASSQSVYSLEMRKV